MGEGFKILKGHNFAAYTETGEDEDPVPNVGPEIGHGTHVAGIVAGKNEWFSGVAPDANILAYKVIGAGVSALISLGLYALKLNNGRAASYHRATYFGVEACL